MPMVGLPPEMLWASIELMKNMAVGHRVDSLAQFFASLSVHDCADISFAMKDAAGLGQGSFHVANLPHASQFTTLESRSAGEGEHFHFWDMETGTASFRTTFDPLSQHRRAIIANACQASLYMVHPEEFHARCASRDLPLPMNDEDAVVLFIYASVGEQFRAEASAVLFLRLYMGGVDLGTALLFSARRSVALDAFGRISEVLPGLRTTPGACQCS